MNARRMLAVAAALVVLGGGFFFWQHGRSAQTTAAPATATVAYGNLQPQVSGTGSIRATAAVTLVAEAAGSLSALDAAVGRRVKAGQVLATIDDQGVAAEHVAQAEAVLAAARTQLDQLRNPAAFVNSDQLTQAGIAVEQARAALAAAQAAYQHAVAGVAQAQAAYKQAEAGVSQATAAYQATTGDETLTAPISGYVVDLPATVGQPVAPGAPVVTLAPDPGAYEIDAQVLDANLYDVSVGEQASAYIPGIGQTLAGTVTQIAGQTDETTPQGSYYKVTIRVATQPGADLAGLGLQAGMSANVNLFGGRVAQTPSTPNVVQVPGGGKTVTASGSVAYAGAWTVTAATAGNVGSLPVSQGQYVDRGGTVATLAGPTLQAAANQASKGVAAAQAGAAQAEAAIGGAQAAVQQAQAAVQQAQAGLDAAQAHVAETQNPSTAPPPQITAQRAAVAQAQAALSAAEQAAAQLSVRAPFNGVVASKLISAGAQVAPGTPIAELVDPSGMQAVIQVPAGQVGLLAAGQPAMLTVEAAGARHFAGRVSQISPQGQNLGGTTVYNVIVDVPHPDGLQPGMAAAATIRVPALHHVLLVPVAAVSGGGGGATVLLVAAHGPRVQPVTTGVSDGRSVEILQGLTAGERIVVPSAGP